MPIYLQYMLLVPGLPPAGWRKAQPAQHHFVAPLPNISSVIKDAVIRETLRLIKNRNLHINEGRGVKGDMKEDSPDFNLSA